MLNDVRYAKTPDTDPWPSPILWGDADLAEAIARGQGIHIYDDFTSLIDLAATGGTNASPPWYAGGTGTGTVKHMTDEFGGAIEIKPSTTLNHEVNMVYGQSGASLRISQTSGQIKALVYEVRLKTSSIANSETSWFAGLVGPGRSGADGIIADGGADLAAISAIGFFRPLADGDAVDFVYKDSAGAIQVKIADLKTLVADTYVKLGFAHLPWKHADSQIEIYADGSRNATKVTYANIAAATFPRGDFLTPGFSVKFDATAAHTLESDWVKAFQEA